MLKQSAALDRMVRRRPRVGDRIMLDRQQHIVTRTEDRGGTPYVLLPPFGWCAVDSATGIAIRDVSAGQE